MKSPDFAIKKRASSVIATKEDFLAGIVKLNTLRITLLHVPILGSYSQNS